jgi:hypothetical protein
MFSEVLYPLGSSLLTDRFREEADTVIALRVMPSGFLAREGFLSKKNIEDNAKGEEEGKVRIPSNIFSRGLTGRGFNEGVTKEFALSCEMYQNSRRFATLPQIHKKGVSPGDSEGLQIEFTGE